MPPVAGVPPLLVPPDEVVLVPPVADEPPVATLPPALLVPPVATLPPEPVAPPLPAPPVAVVPPVPEVVVPPVACAPPVLVPVCPPDPLPLVEPEVHAAPVTRRHVTRMQPASRSRLLFVVPMDAIPFGNVPAAVSEPERRSAHWPTDTPWTCVVTRGIVTVCRPPCPSPAGRVIIPAAPRSGAAPISRDTRRRGCRSGQARGRPPTPNPGRCR
jgi:hypothetical protein